MCVTKPLILYIWARGTPSLVEDEDISVDVLSFSKNMNVTNYSFQVKTNLLNINYKIIIFIDFIFNNYLT